MSVVLFFSIGGLVLLVGFGLLALTFRHHYLVYKNKSAEDLVAANLSKD